MVNNTNLDKLKRQKRITGHQLGRILLENLLDQLYGQNEITSDKDIQKLKCQLSDVHESEIYNTYVNIYSTLIDSYNYIQSYRSNALLNITLINNELANIMNYMDEQIYGDTAPLNISERQYKKYKSTYNHKIEEIQKKRNNSKQKLVQILQRILGVILTKSQDYNTGLEKYPNIQKMLGKYKNEFISEYGYKLIKKIIIDIEKKNNRINHQLIQDYFQIFIKTDDHDKELKEQLPKNSSSSQLVKTGILEEYLKQIYEKKQSHNKAINLALKKYHISFSHPEINNYITELAPLPQKLTKQKIYKYIISNFQSLFLDFVTIECGSSINTHDMLEFERFLANNFTALFQAAVHDISRNNPELGKLLSFSKAKELLSKKISYKELAQAGDEFAQYITSLEIIKADPNYGIWIGFPKKYQEKVHYYGFSIFHATSKLNELKNENQFFDRIDNNKKKFNQMINNLIEGKKHNEIKQYYNAVYQYLVIYQAYKEFIEGIVKFSNDTNLRSFETISENNKVLSKINLLRLTRNLAVYDVDQNTKGKETQNFATTFPIINPHKEYIIKRNIDDIASFITNTFSADKTSPISAAVILNRLVEGIIDD